MENILLTKETVELVRANNITYVNKYIYHACFFLSGESFMFQSMKTS